MKHNDAVLTVMGVLGGIFFGVPAVSAFELDVDIGHPRREEVVVVQPAPAVMRVWVPTQVVKKQEQVLVEAAFCFDLI